MPSASRLARWSLGSFGSLARLGGSFGGVCASVPLGSFLCRGAVPPFSCLSSGFALVALGAVCFCDRVRVSGALRPASAVVPGCLCSCRLLELGLRPCCPCCGLFLWSGSGFRGSATRSCGRAGFVLASLLVALRSLLALWWSRSPCPSPRVCFLLPFGGWTVQGCIPHFWILLVSLRLFSLFVCGFLEQCD